jgi:hypothetical protein
MRNGKWQHYISVRGLLMTALIVVTAVIVGVTIWYPRSVPTDAPDEKYPPAATSEAPAAPVPSVAPVVVAPPPPAPPSTTAVETPTTTAASQTYSPTYVPPPVVSDVPATTAPSATEAPPPSPAPSTRSRPKTNVTRSDNPYHVPTFTGVPKP